VPRMANSDKKEFVLAFFGEFRKKVARLSEMYSNSYPDEAFTLCVVYIDHLASGYYGGEAGKNRENFCRALRLLSSDPLFAMLHPREMLEQIQRRFPGAVPIINSIVGSQAHSLLDESAVAAAIQSSAMRPLEKQNLIENLWRASIASICYAQIRGPGVHGPGGGGLDFDETVYQGKTGVRIDFELVYTSLSRIFEYVRDASVQSGHWFGNPNYPQARP
jgi:hypothetical protein